MTEAAGRLAWISVAPVKAMAMTFLDRATVGREGIPGDRAFAVLDGNGRLVNGSGLGSLATIRPTWEPVSGRLILRFPDGSDVEGIVEPGEPLPADIFGKLRPARAVGGPWDEAISAWAGRPLHLALMDPGEGIDREGTVSILSSAALGALAAAGGASEPLDPRRFRMTFGLEAVEAHAEDGWLGRSVRIGDVVVRVAGNVGRCAVTTHDPDTGRPSFKTLHVLKRTRGHLPTTEPLPCGVWADVEADGSVAVGDSVEVLGP